MAHAYYYRGIVLLFLSEWESAEADLTTAKQWFDIACFFRNEYKSVTEFEKKFNVTLPADIKALLTYKGKD